jgi:ABC-type uncharacterized transport system substrate-binding protein
LADISGRHLPVVQGASLSWSSTPRPPGRTDIPVLFAISGDPVELGLVKTLARPGGNFTGSTFLSLDLAGKGVQLLKDVFPQLRTLAVLSNTDHPGERSERQQAAQALGIDLVYVPFVGARELDSALAVAGNARANAMLIFPEGATMVPGPELPSSPSLGDYPRCSGGASIATPVDC